MRLAKLPYAGVIETKNAPPVVENDAMRADNERCNFPRVL